MNITDKKKILLALARAALCLMIFAAVFTVGIRLIPKAITYTVSTSQNGAVTHSQEAPSCPYDSIYDIEESGPFTIGADGDRIYIYSEDAPIYRIRALLSEFPPSDREAILSGIEAPDKASLIEFAEYLES